MNTKKIACSGFLIALGVLLPVIFHFMPGNLGLMMLPIHYSSYFAGGFFGPVIGGIVGLLTPFISHQLTGMPDFPIYLYISLETLVYGLVFGYLYHMKRYNVYLSLLVAMIIGRLANILGNFLIASVLLPELSRPFIFLNIIKNFSIGIVGAIIQIIIIPIVIKRVNTVFSFTEDKKKGLDV